jgi:hypothetical protein
MTEGLQNKWHPFKNGATIGDIGSENGIIIRDDEYLNYARISIERGGGSSTHPKVVAQYKKFPYAITLGIYDWTVYTFRLQNEQNSQKAFDSIKLDIEKVVAILSQNNGEFEANYPSARDAFEELIENAETFIRNSMSK